MTKFLALEWHINNIVAYLCTSHFYQQQTAAQNNALYTWRTLTDQSVAVQWKRVNKYCSECRLPRHTQRPIQQAPGFTVCYQQKYVNIKKTIVFVRLNNSCAQTPGIQMLPMNCTVGTNVYNAGSALPKKFDCYHQKVYRKQEKLFVRLLQMEWNTSAKKWPGGMKHKRVRASWPWCWHKERTS